MSEATNCLYKAMIEQSISLEKRCRRYTVLLSMAAKKGVPYETTISQLSSLHEDIVDQHLQSIDVKRKTMLFMTAIDRYRVSKLEPSFIDLIECLKQIDLPQVYIYLHDRELILLEELYHQILSSPDTKIDLCQVDMDNLHPAFYQTLRLIFSGHLKDEINNPAGDSQAELKQEDATSGAQCSRKNREQQVAHRMNAEERRLFRLEKKRKRERQRRENLQGDDWHRHREAERLRQRRVRLMESTIQQQERLRQQQRRRSNGRERKTDQQRLLDYQIGQYLQRRSQQSETERYYPDQLSSDFVRTQAFAPVNELIGASVIADSGSQQRQQLKPLSAMDNVSTQVSRGSQLPSGHFQQNERTQPPLSDPTITFPHAQIQEKRFRLGQPHVRPMMPFPHFAPNMTPQEASPSFFPMQTYPTLDQLLHNNDDGGNQQVIGNQDQLDSLTSPRSLFQVQPSGPNTYNYMTESESRDGRSPSTGSIMSYWNSNGPATDRSNSIDDLTSVASQFDDTEALVSSFFNPTPPAAMTRDTLFSADVSDLGDPWDDFDRELTRSKVGH